MSRINRKRNRGKVFGDVPVHTPKESAAGISRGKEAVRTLPQGHVLKKLQVPDVARPEILTLKIVNGASPLQAKDLLISLPKNGDCVPVAGSGWKPSAKIEAEYWYLPDLLPQQAIYSPHFETGAADNALVELLLWNGAFDKTSIPELSLDLVILDRTEPELEVELSKGFNIEIG